MGRDKHSREPRPEIKDLRRRLVLLDRLRGQPLRAAEGLLVVDFDADDGAPTIRDPKALYEACAAGWPATSTITAAVALAEPPLLLRPALLAQMHRDLRALSKWHGLREVVAEAPRLFRRFGDPDDAWLAAKRERLAELAETLRALEGGADASADGADDDARDRRVRALVEALRGPQAAAAVDAAVGTLRDDSRRRRRQARRRLLELLAALGQPPSARPAALRETVAELEAIARIPGRSSRRRLEHRLGGLLAIAPPPERIGLAGDHERDPVGAVTAVGDRLIASIQPTRGPDLDRDARRFFGLYALAFDPLPRPGGAPEPLTPAALRRGLRDFDAAWERLGGLALTIDEVLRLRRLDLRYGERATAELVAAGVSIAAVERLAADGRADDLHHFRGDPEAAAAYAEWFATLAPHYAAMGLEVPLDPEQLGRLLGERSRSRRDLGILALCLMTHHRAVGSAGAPAALARLDATFALFAARPAEADAILEDLSATSPGAGRARFPEFCDWLGGAAEDDEDAEAIAALVDRFVHLSRLAGRPLTLSRRLRADFERDAALRRQRAHLEGLAARSPDQERRLARLRAGDVADSDPGRTRRRLDAEVELLLGEAYEVQVDGVFRRIIKDVWGLHFDRLTPSWRDAIRFYLGTVRNHELLRTVLRSAAAGADLSRTLPANLAWIDGVRGRFDVDAWLAPRRHSVDIDGQRGVLEIERDPVEVLRMGVPFDTCLSITGGFNAASTVINAADANKQVIYLRDRRGKIIARKLIAIAERDGADAILGYHLYIADKERAAAIRAAFAAFADELAAAVGLPLACAGAPAQLHEGFWYDDGVEPFTGAAAAATPVDVVAYCAALGLPPPATTSERLRDEARLFRALQDGDPEAVLAALREVYAASPLQDAAIAWLRAALGDEVVHSRLPERSIVLEERLVDLNARPRALLTWIAELRSWRLHNLLAAIVPGPAHARALVDAALAIHDPDARFDDHGLEHRSLDLLPEWIAVTPIAEALQLAGRIAPLWDWIADNVEGCRDCVLGGQGNLEEALVARYAEAPDPDPVLKTMFDKRSQPLLRDLALRLAATYALDGDDPQAMRPAPTIARRLGRLLKRNPDLAASPEFTAALLRQTGGDLPHGVDLPAPTEHNFPGGYLGTWALRPAIRAHLDAWLETPPAPDWRPENWNPGGCELALRRRRDPARPSPLCLALRREAMRWAPHVSAATDWLARLGDLEGLRAVSEAPPRSRPPGAPKATIRFMAKAERLAGLIMAQVDAADRGAIQGLDISELRSAHSDLGGGRALDDHLVHVARATFNADLARPTAADDDVALRRLEVAAALLRLYSAVRPPDRRGLLRRLAALPPARMTGPRRLVTETLLSANTYLWSGWSPELALDLGAHPALHDKLFARLCFAFSNGLLALGIRTLRAAAERSGDPERVALAEALIPGWRRAALVANADEIVDENGPLFAAAVVDTIEDRRCHLRVLDAYDAIASPARAAECLGLLWSASPRTRAEFVDAVDGMWDEDDDDLDDDEVDELALRAWMRACLAGELPRAPGLDLSSVAPPTCADPDPH